MTKPKLPFFTGLALSTCLSISCKTVETINASAGIGRIETTNSKFDGAKEFRMSPAMVSRDGGVRASDIHLGAAYSQSMGESMILTLTYQEAIHIINTAAPGDFHNITALDINIDGRKQTFVSIKQTRFTGNYTSSNVFSVPIATVNEMIDAKDCRIRMVTLHGQETALFHVETASMGQVFAKRSLRKFLTTIEVFQ